MSTRKLFWLFLLLFLSHILASAQDPLILTTRGKSISLLASAADYPGVIRAFRDLQHDLEKVGGILPAFYLDSIPDTCNLIIAGTIGSPIISDLIERRIIQPSIEGKWESFHIEVVSHPFPGTDRALVIAGSDKRGTIYGIYEISARIGVSPWYWWADVVPEHKDSLSVNIKRIIQGPPSVKYRGIFLNDEAPDLTNWIYAKFGQASVSKDPPVPAGIAGYNHEFYSRIFELLLRLKGNYLWPAMWNNAFNEDDTSNARLADEYGIVMGTSHQEPMLRAQKEWDRRYQATLGSWNYTKHGEILENFWREGIRRNKNYESIVTVGLRGADDTEMAPGGPEANRALLEQIVDNQRKILREEIDTDITRIPQVWCLYKEVLDYYKDGMRVPDDVTLLWAEDNWGNVRRLPTAEERNRKGGAGIYYHFDYHGGPRSYQWINANPLPKIWDQMTLAKQFGADRIWIVNTGHLKGYELPVSFFLDMAWNTDSLKNDNLDAYTREWACRQFGDPYGEAAGRILTLYTRYNGRRKPELLRPDTYSLVNYNEAERVVKDYRQLQKDAEALYNNIPASKKDAFYQVVLFPVKACAIVNDLYLAAGLNELYARQGRASTNEMAARTEELFRADTSLMSFYNNVYADGRWNHFMDQTHLGYTGWRDPPENTLEAVTLERLSIPIRESFGVAVEGSGNSWPGSHEEAVLPSFDNLNDQEHYIELFRTGTMPCPFKITSSSKWISISENNGILDHDKRIMVSILWDKIKSAHATGNIIIESPGIEVKVGLTVDKYTAPSGIKAFIESNGYISIEADHFNRKTDSESGKWIRIENYGHTHAGMRAIINPDAPLPETNALPCLEYDVYTFRDGQVYVDPVFAPSLNFIAGRPVRYAISFDDEEPQVITLVPQDFDARNGNREWEQSVSDNFRKGHSVHVLSSGGSHVLKIRVLDPGIVLQKIVVNTGGLRPSYLGPPESIFLEN